MKKIIFIGLSILIAFTSAAQTTKWNVDVAGGPTYASLRGNSILEDLNDPRIGYSLGLGIQYNLNTMFSLRTGIAFERKGASVTNDVKDSIGNIYARITDCDAFDYVSVPLMLRVTLGNKIKYFVNAGPYVAFLLKQTTFKESKELFSPYSYENTNNFEPFDIGISAGLGALYPIRKNISVSAELRNNLGLTDISVLPTYQNGGIRTNAINLLIGLQIGLNTKNQSNKS